MKIKIWDHEHDNFIANLSINNLNDIEIDNPFKFEISICLNEELNLYSGDIVKVQHKIFGEWEAVLIYDAMSKKFFIDGPPISNQVFDIAFYNNGEVFFLETNFYIESIGNIFQHSDLMKDRNYLLN